MTKPGGAEVVSLTGRVLHPGVGRGELVVLSEPVSFWGGVSGAGEIVDAHHPQRGISLAGTVVAMRTGRGSSSASSVLAEQIRSGHAPAAILLTEPDTILTLGAVVAAELYEVTLPIAVLTPFDYDRLPRCGVATVGAAAAFDAAATIRVTARGTRDAADGRVAATPEGDTP